ncbi:hypothetical protein Emin_0813 [Elusimicrobium minutum Pei191]|uniref:Uncharacterized protein n=1 Tax=Elusimicrobium minutum (strain Pei191) TaxID=445932 RepID=B2KCX2_ELUMP|nr:hypothetical protein [Elusimicrobium minutum]ACC98368.1 hypothetical protein Emin_0813 [Elusimicrobium minutum Pei191]
MSGRKKKKNVLKKDGEISQGACKEKTPIESLSDYLIGDGWKIMTFLGGKGKK